MPQSWRHTCTASHHPAVKSVLTAKALPRTHQLLEDLIALICRWLLACTVLLSSAATSARSALHIQVLSRWCTHSYMTDLSHLAASAAQSFAESVVMGHGLVASCCILCIGLHCIACLDLWIASGELPYAAAP